MLEEPNRLASCLQHCCKTQTIWFPVCNDVARPKPFSFLFATMLQRPNRLVSRLQQCCKAQTVWFLVCNDVARAKLFGFSFATLLQEPNRLVSRLQRCCKAQTIWFLAYGLLNGPISHCYITIITANANITNFYSRVVI